MRSCGLNERKTGRNLTRGEGFRNGIKKVKERCLRVLDGDMAAVEKIFVLVHAYE